MFARSLHHIFFVPSLKHRSCFWFLLNTMWLTDKIGLFLAASFLIPSTALAAKSGKSSKTECEKKFKAVDEAVAKISIALAPNARPFKDLEDFAENYCT